MTFLIALLAVPSVLLTLCFAAEVFSGLMPLRPLTVARGRQPSAVIVVPAHDEEPVLHVTLERLKAAAEGQARILLVADNCRDRTPQIGRDLGVEVLERNDLQRRGKGYALDFARAYLSSNPPEVVLIVDADCLIDRESVSHLIRSCSSSARPCQATNLQQPRLDGSPLVQLSSFAFFIKNVIRQRALKRLAGRVHLLGTGMAFPWEIFATSELATSNIVEDLKLGLELAEKGHATIFIEQAAIWSRAETGANTISQRRRWEGGYLQNAASVAPLLLRRALVRGDPRSIWAALDLLIPPFALLLLLDLIALVAGTVLAWLFSAHYWPLCGLLAAVGLALFALALAWLNGGSKYVRLSSLARAPLYVLWKLPMYVGIVRRGAPKEWVRTER